MALRLRRPSSGVPSLTPALRRRLVWAGLVAVAGWILLENLAPSPRLAWTPEMTLASRTMAHGLEVSRDHCRARGILVEGLADPQETCLVGPMMSPLFTTLGQLEAKKTTLTPDVAGLLVHLLREAGVGEGDGVALGASGSFPALLLGAQAAVEALGAEALPILSLGSSAYGATRTELHLLDLHTLWRAGGVLSGAPVAVSLGGGGDVGRGFDEALQEQLRTQVRESGIPLLDEGVLPANVARRMALYGDVAAFVNIGGGTANLGTSPLILEVPPGLSTPTDLPPEGERGVLFAMAAQGIPVIHLLYLQGLALRHGLPWDPAVLPEPGTTSLLALDPGPGLTFWLVTGAFLASLLLVFLLPRGGRPE